MRSENGGKIEIGVGVGGNVIIETEDPPATAQES